MNFDELPDQLEAFFDRARAVLDREISKARNAVAALNSEKATTQATLWQLRDQHRQAKTQLDAMLADLNRASGLVGLTSEIAEARKTLQKLKAETAEATTALEAVNKQRADGERQLVAVTNELSRLRHERVEHDNAIGSMRALLKSFEVRRSA